MDLKKFLPYCEFLIDVIMLVSYILLITQSFNNYFFRNYKTKELTIERLLYEQFSYEINSNLNSPSFTLEYNSSYNNINRYIMELEVKKDSFYDCTGVKDDELNEEKCQNKKVNNYTCCRAECCIRTNGNNLYCNEYTFNSNNDLNKYILYNDEELLEDPKRGLCTYYNEYYKNISHMDLTNIPLYQLKYNYKSLYLNNNKNKKSVIYINKTCYNYSDCGIVDTKNNHLCIENNNFCPINEVYLNNNVTQFNKISYNLPIIIRNILSEIPPETHEWRNYFVNSETKKKISKINIKEINTFLNDKKANKNVYQKQEEYKMNTIINYIGNSNININEKEKIYWYTTNYIGFGAYKDLEKFNDKFSSEKDNNLYKIGNEILPSLESIIIGFIFLILCLVHLILKCIKFFDTYPLYISIIKFIILFVSFIYELVFYVVMTNKFENIMFDIHDNYKEILKLYNKRRFQSLLLTSVILLGISVLLNTVGFIFSLKNKDDNQHLIQAETEENIINNNNNINNHMNNSIRAPFNNNNNVNENLRESENRELINNLNNIINNNIDNNNIINNIINNNIDNNNNVNNNNNILRIHPNRSRGNLLPSIRANN